MKEADKKPPPPSAAPTGVQRILGGALPAPSRGAPNAPADSPTLHPSQRKRLVRPHKAHLDIAPDVIRELRTSTSFTSVVGASLADPRDLADAIEIATAWVNEVRATERWLEHAETQSALAWHGVFDRLQRIRAPLLSAQELTPALADELFAFTRLVTARGDASARAAETVRKRKSAAASSSEPSRALASAAPEPPGQAPSVQASAPQLLARTVASSAAAPAASAPEAPRGKRADKRRPDKRRRRG